MRRDRRDRERAICPRCGREVTVTRSGRLMAHRGTDPRVSCVSAAWKERQAAERERAAARDLEADS